MKAEIETPDQVIAKRLGGRDIVSLGDVAAAADVSRATVLAWIESGEIPAVNISSRADGPAHWRMNRIAVAEFFRGRREGCR